MLPSDVGATMAKLQSLGVGVHVIGQSPLFGNEVQTLFAQSGGGRTQPDGWGFVTFDSELNHKLAAAMPPGVQFVDPLARLCHLPSCPYREQSTFMMWDEGHFSLYGSKLAVASYFPYFERK